MLTAILLAGTACLGQPNSTGVPARVTAELSTDANAIDLLTEDGPPFNAALTFWGTIPMDPVPFGQGELCINPYYLQRIGAGTINPAGRFQTALNVDVLPETAYFQTIYRDFNGDAFNLSGLAVLELPAATAPAVSAHFSIPDPIPGERYEIVVPKPDPVRGCAGVRFYYDYETIIDVWAGTYPGHTHPGGSYAIASCYWIYNESDQPVSPAKVWYSGLMPPLGDGEVWETQLVGSHPFYHTVNNAYLRTFQRRQGPVRLYLEVRESGFWPGSHHGYQWFHTVDYDLSYGRVEYLDWNDEWYVPGG